MEPIGPWPQRSWPGWACAVILLVSAGDGVATGGPRNKTGAKIAPLLLNKRLRELGGLAQEGGTALWYHLAHDEVNPEVSVGLI